MAEGKQQQSPSKQRLMWALKSARDLLPGDSRYGDPLSTAGSEPRNVVARQLTELAQGRPGLLSEVGLGALQVWQAVADDGTRGSGNRRIAIAFTDLVRFSDWALDAGDTATLHLLRDVGEAIEPPVTERGGEVVKRLGDGMMAAFADPQQAVEAIFDARNRLAAVEAPGFRPRIRAGVHVGMPRRLGEDYFGVDVNVAARVAEHASGDELLASGQAADELDPDAVRLRKKLLFRARGVPSDITVYSVKPR
jgi:adenylate cyclase